MPIAALTLACLAAIAPPAEVDTVHFCCPHHENDLRLFGWLEHVPREDARIPEGGIAGGPNVETVVDSGDPANRVDLVFVGDGFTESELDTFAPAVVDAFERLFEYEPFATYRPYFNVHRVDVISAESGVDNDPDEGILRDTALDMRFFCNGIERLLCVNVGSASFYADLAPDVDQILAVANSSKYGGAGYASADTGTFSAFNDFALEVVVHELGHSLGELADEYTYGGPAEYDGPEPTSRNASIFEEATMLDLETKWWRWLGRSLPGVGVHATFEGARYSETGIHRPSSNSMMRSLQQPFNGPSRESLIREIYELVDPIDSVEPAGSTVRPSAQVRVTPMRPIGHELDVEWTLDGKPVGTDEVLDLRAVGARPGDTVTVTVTDATDEVLDPVTRETFLTESRSWTVIAPDADINDDGIVNGADLAIIIGSWNTTDPIADLDGSGLVDGGDLAFVLASWG